MTKYNRARIVRVYGVLAVLLLAAVWVDINAGYRPISLAEMMQIFSGGGEASLRYTLLELRLPRVLTSLLVGVGLSVAGCVLQGLSRNDMAEPGILGLNAGAGLFVAVFIVFFAGGSLTTSFWLPILAFDRHCHVHRHHQPDHHAHAANVGQRLCLCAKLAFRKHLGGQLVQCTHACDWLAAACAFYAL